MQLKTLKQKQKLQTTFGAQLASFQKFTDEMVAKYGGASEPELENVTRDDTQTAVATVLQFIDTMHESLLGYHEQDKTKAGECSAMNISQECQSIYLDNDKKDDIKSWNQTANDHHDDFLLCMTERAGACGASNTLCDRYDTYRTQDKTVLQGGFVRGDGTEPQYLPECVENGKFGEAFIRASYETEAAKLATMEACLIKTNEWLNGIKAPPALDDSISTAVVEQYDGLYPHYEQCDRTQDTCTQHHTYCKNNQTKFETEHCSYYQNWDSSCGSWQKCYKAGKDTCSGESGDCTVISNNVQGRKADNETGMRLKCLLQVLFGEWDGVNFAERLPAEKRAQALTNCTKKEYDLSEWDIPCGLGNEPNPPDICTKGVCHAEAGTTIFKQSYYISEGLKEPDASVPENTPKHGTDKHFFDLAGSCEMLEGHESYSCDEVR